MKVQEPSEINITDTPGDSYILVYVNDGIINGLRRLKLSDWKAYLNFNEREVLTLGELTGFTESEIQGYVPSGWIDLKTRIENIKDNLMGQGYSYDDVMSTPVITTLTNVVSDIGDKDTQTEGSNSIHQNISSLLGKVSAIEQSIGESSDPTSLLVKISGIQSDIGQKQPNEDYNPQEPQENTIHMNISRLIDNVGKTKYDNEGDNTIHQNVSGLLTSVENIGTRTTANEASIQTILTKLEDKYCIYKGSISSLPQSEVEKGWLYTLSLSSPITIDGVTVYSGGVVIVDDVNEGTITWKVLYNPVPVFNREPTFDTRNLNSDTFYLLICFDTTSANPSKVFVYKNNAIYDSQSNIGVYFNILNDPSTAITYFTNQSNVNVIYHKIG